MGKCEKKSMILVVGVNFVGNPCLPKLLASRYDVREAADGVAGLSMAQTLLPDLVISNADAPCLNGIRLCGKLKKSVKTNHIPIVLVSGKGSEASIVKGFKSGADDCIAWPFNAKIFKARVKNLVDSRRRLLNNLRRHITINPAQADQKPTDEEFIQRLMNAVEENLSNPLFNVEGLCARLKMSRPSIYRRLHTATGLSPQMFIRSYRLKRAAQLLESSYGNVTEVCFRVGFTSTAYFTKCFKEKFQRSPRSYYNSPNLAKKPQRHSPGHMQVI
jgi:AraC-like DNA-binding protein